MKTLFLISIFTFFTAILSFGQFTPPASLPIESDEIVVYFQDVFDTTLVLQAQDQLENFNEEKVKNSRYDMTNEVFYIRYTADLNKVELLAIFKDLGMSPYLIENGFKYTLNGTNSGLVSQEIE